MKKFFYLALIVALFSACNETTDYQITGTVADAGLNDNYVYLYEYGKADAPARDSALVENGKFAMKGTQDVAVLSYLTFAPEVVERTRVGTGENRPYAAIILLENGKFKATLSESSSSSVTGTPANDAYAALLSQMKKERANTAELNKEMKADDPAVVLAAEEKLDQIERDIAVYVKEFILTHNDSPLSAKLLFDFRYALDEDQRREIINKVGNTVKSFPGIDKIADHLNTLEKVAIGKKFTDFEMNDPAGKTHKLSEYVGNGKVVLIDFWASWCPPCRRDMPHLVEIYKQYKGKNFEIVGVSLDRTNDAWVKGINDLNITWPQISDLKYWQSEGAALYGVNSIPHTVLVGADGVILAKNLRGKALDAKLQEVVK